MRVNGVAILLVCTLIGAGPGCRRKAEKAAPPVAAPAVVAPAAAPAPAQAAAPPAKVGRAAIRHVVIISEDGLRPDALMGVRPPVHEAILKRAAYSLQARTIRRASTLPSHAAMLSGFDIKEHGLFWNSWHPDRGYIHVPTVFDAAAKNGGSAAFIGKRKLEHIAHPGSVDVVSRPGYFCRKVVDEATRYFVEKKPAVEFIHFSDPDDTGHSDGWMSDPQLESIGRCGGAVEPQLQHVFAVERKHVAKGRAASRAERQLLAHAFFLQEHLAERVGGDLGRGARVADGQPADATRRR